MLARHPTISNEISEIYCLVRAKFLINQPVSMN